MLATLLLCAATAGAADAHETVCKNLLKDRLRVLAIDRLHSTLSQAFGYELGFVPLLADDVVLVVRGLPIIEGKDAARAYFAGLDPDERLAWTPTRIDASVDGTLGTSWGWTTATGRADDGTATTKLGRNIAVWKRTARGWRVAAYSQGASAPPQPTPDGFELFPEEPHRCATATDPAVTTALIEDTDAAFAALSVAEGYPLAFATYAAPDGVLRGAGRLFIGPQAILDDFYGGNVSPTLDLLDWAPSAGAAARSADLGWTVGNAVETIFDPGGNAVFTGTYLTLWKKQPDGTWRYVLGS
jgi:ketosteroid isomerase-like protein